MLIRRTHGKSGWRQARGAPRARKGACLAAVSRSDAREAWEVRDGVGGCRCAASGNVEAHANRIDALMGFGWLQVMVQVVWGCSVRRV